MNVLRRKLFNSNGKETGSILTAVLGVNNANQKTQIENHLTEYAHNVLYPNMGLHIFSDINADTAAITIIINGNDLPFESLTIN